MAMKNETKKNGTNDLAGQVAIIERGYLEGFVSDTIARRFADREVGTNAAAEVLGVSVDTINRWLDHGLLRTSNDAKKGVPRKFYMRDLLDADTVAIKKQYRMLNK
jgi:hypothetical protein